MLTLPQKTAPTPGQFLKVYFWVYLFVVEVYLFYLQVDVRRYESHSPQTFLKSN